MLEFNGIYGFKLWDMAGDVLILQPDRICGNTSNGQSSWSRPGPFPSSTQLLNSAVPWGLNEEKLKYFFGVGSFLCSSRSYSSCLCASPLLRMSREARNPSSPILKYMIMPQRSLWSCARILSSQNIQWEFKLIQFLHNKSPDTLVVTHALNLATSTYLEAFVFKRHTILLLDFRLTNCRLALGIPWDFWEEGSDPIEAKAEQDNKEPKKYWILSRNGTGQPQSNHSIDSRRNTFF